MENPTKFGTLYLNPSSKHILKVKWYYFVRWLFVHSRVLFIKLPLEFECKGIKFYYQCACSDNNYLVFYHRLFVSEEDYQLAIKWFPDFYIDSIKKGKAIFRVYMLSSSKYFLVAKYYLKVLYLEWLFKEDKDNSSHVDISIDEGY